MKRLLPTLLFLLAASPALAHPPAERPEAALARAAAMGARVLLPADLPPGSRLIAAEANRDQEGPGYSATYRVGGGPVGFGIEMVSGGIGSVTEDDRPVARVRLKHLPAKWPTVLYWYPGFAGDRGRTWLSEWATDEKAARGAWRFVGVGNYEAADRARLGISRDVDRRWATRILASLAPWPAKMGR